MDSAIKKYKGYLPEEDIMLKFVQIALALHYTHSKVHHQLFTYCWGHVQVCSHAYTKYLMEGYGADAGFAVTLPYHSCSAQNTLSETVMGHACILSMVVNYFMAIHGQAHHSQHAHPKSLCVRSYCEQRCTASGRSVCACRASFTVI